MWQPAGSLDAIDIASSGLAAERKRMEVIANNVANANTTRGSNEGEPFRRQEVIFEAAMASAGGGVRVTGVREDPSELPKLFKPTHPHADEAGFVTMPNVVVSNEMVDLMVASRAYEANLSSIKSVEEATNSVIELLR